MKYCQQKICLDYDIFVIHLIDIAFACLTEVSESAHSIGFETEILHQYIHVIENILFHLMSLPLILNALIINIPKLLVMHYGMLAF